MKMHNIQNWCLYKREDKGKLSSVEIKVLNGKPSGGYMIQSMPSMVHTILKDEGIIDDPWKPGIAKDILWVAESDWIYRGEFEKQRIESEIVRILLEGADTILDVYINGQHVGSSEDSYSPIEYDISSYLADENVVLLHFRSVFSISGSECCRVQFVDNDPQRLIRKSEQNYTNYLGPQPLFCPVGIFGNVKIQEVGGGEIRQFTPLTSLSPDLNRGYITLECLGSVSPGSGELNLELIDNSLNVISIKKIPLEGGFQVKETLICDNPALWWPRGYGSRPLYKLRATLFSGESCVQKIEKTLGFRRIEMLSPLHFTVNNAPIKLWGACWVTPDWADRVWNHERASKLLDIAENAHFNTLRVWGVVESPPDDFYEMADRRGILIWQDFTDMPLAPNDLNRRLARKEAVNFIHRLRHHPSILLWCGDNESAMWHDFSGKKEPFPGREIAEEVIGDVVKELDKERFYLPSSPYFGFDANDPQDHNTHGYTNMWFVHGYDYLNFVTEDTRISAPELSSLRRFMLDEDIYPADFDGKCLPGKNLPWPDSWMKYTASVSERKIGPAEQFYDSHDALSLVYRIGMAAGLYYRDTIERQRRGRPAKDTSGIRRCGGYLAWKFNDSWPEIYSAKVDYFLEPYLVYYLIRRAYSPLLVSIEVGSHIHIWVVNDTREPVTGTLTVKDWHIEKNCSTRSLVRNVSISPGCSEPIAELTEFRTIERRNLIHAILDSEEGVRLGESIALLDNERNIPFPKARLDLKFNGENLEITTDQYAHSVVLTGDDEGDEFNWMFEDNYFNIMPGETKRVAILGHHTKGIIRAKAFYSPHESELIYKREN
jgi:beta-mannosidase